MLGIVHDVFALGANMWTLVEEKLTAWTSEHGLPHRDAKSLKFKFDNLSGTKIA